MKELFERLFDHLWWADRRVLTLVHSCEAARQRPVVRLFSHLLAAERIWLQRLQGVEAEGPPIWPELRPEELEELVSANLRDYHRFLMGLGEHDLVREVEYTNSQGVTFRTAVGDILAHIALHGSHHRGQIAAALRAAGAEPVNTDFITFARESAGPVRASVPPGAG